MTLEQIITLITLIIGLVGAVAALIPTVIKLVKALKEIVSNKNWNAIKNIAMTAMKEVEEHYRANPTMSSDEKLDMAIDIIQASCKEMGIDITEDLIRDLTDYIKETIEWANNMKN